MLRPPLAFAAVFAGMIAGGCDGCRSSRPDAAAAVDAGPGADPSRAAVEVVGDAGARPPPAPMPRGWLKGQLHAHSSGSGDSQTPAADVHRWYEERGYDFIVFTDHNVVTDTPDDARTLTMPGVELTINPPSCEPPTPPGNPCTLHTNALFVDPLDAATPLGEPPSPRRRDVYLHELALTKSLGGVAMLNHPNLYWAGPDAMTLVDLAHHGLGLLEIRNEAWDSQNDGDKDHPSTEALWDAALSRGAHLFGTATDDAHHYADAAKLRARGERPFDGDRGFVVVRSAKTPAAIRAALVAGDFYASTGLVLARYETLPSGGTGAARDPSMIVETNERAAFEVIGKEGVVVRRAEGTRLEATLESEDGPYVRVRIKRDADGAMAWTQPLFR